MVICIITNTFMSTVAKLRDKFKQYTIKNTRTFSKKCNSNIRIMTFNVHLWKDYNDKISYDKIIELIKDSNSDVIGLLESLFFSVKSDKLLNDLKELGYEYVVMCNPKYGINILASKFEIIDSIVIPLCKDPIKCQARYAIRAKIKVSDKDIISVVLVHLDVYDETEDTRHKQICKILKDYKNADIIMGDFNSLREQDYSENEWTEIKEDDVKRNVISQTKVISEIEKLFTDSFSITKAQSPKISVWSNRRVDYIYVNDSSLLKLHDSQIYPTLVSDHYPIYIDFSLKN